jgi:hypothetical protein
LEQQTKNTMSLDIHLTLEVVGIAFVVASVWKQPFIYVGIALLVVNLFIK